MCGIPIPFTRSFCNTLRAAKSQQRASSPREDDNHEKTNKVLSAPDSSVLLLLSVSDKELHHLGSTEIQGLHVWSQIQRL